MSRAALATILGVLVLGAAVAGLFLWERAGDRSAGDSRPRAERLLIGLNPQTVKRVRFRYGDRTVELERRHRVWEPTSTASQGVTVRVDVLLQRIATLRVRLATGTKSRRRNLGRPLADIKVWRGRATPIMVRFYQADRQLVITTSDRPGIYHADAKILAVIRRELQRPQLPPIWPLKPLALASVEIATTSPLTTVTLVRRSKRWFLEDSSALAPADSTAVGRMLRTLQTLRVTHRLGQGVSAVSKHGLDKPRMTVRVDDGTKRTLRLGGPCPRSKGGVVATVGGKSPTVVCVTRPEPQSLTGPFVSTRLFSLAADEIKAIRVTRAKRSLALTHHPGSGGWRMIAPSEGVVDQIAAASFVASMARLDGAPPSADSPPPPDKARRMGSVVLTPLVGSKEELELHATRKNVTLWARRTGGARWIRIRATDVRLFTADPVLLRTRNLCAEPGKRILRLAKTHPSRVTELVLNQRGTWQLVLLAGRLSLDKATRIGTQLKKYRPTGRQPTTAAKAMVWKRPVLLVSSPDRAHFNTLLHHVKAIRAQGFVASRARREHGFGAQGMRLSFFYQHSCKNDATGKQHCQRSGCDLELGGPLDGGGCYGRQTGDPAVFVASAALCKAARSPLASRRAVSDNTHQLAGITLQTGGKTRRLTRTPNGGWNRPPKVSAMDWESSAGALLRLAPLTTRAVEGYIRGRKTKLGQRELTVVLTVKAMPNIQLDFYDDESDSEHRWMVRKGLPMRYKVSIRMVRNLKRLAGFK
jgi:Domain of unknown function (DUF4340)